MKRFALAVFWLASLSAFAGQEGLYCPPELFGPHQGDARPLCTSVGNCLEIKTTPQTDAKNCKWFRDKLPLGDREFGDCVRFSGNSDTCGLLSPAAREVCYQVFHSCHRMPSGPAQDRCWEQSSGDVSWYAALVGFENAVEFCNQASTEKAAEACFQKLISHATVVTDLRRNVAAVESAAVAGDGKDRLYFHAANRQYVDFPSLDRRIAVCHRIARDGVAQACERELRSPQWARIEAHFKSVVRAPAVASGQSLK